MPTRLALVLVLGAAPVLGACDEEREIDDRQVARDTVAALSSSSAQLGLYDGLLGPVNLSGISLALAPTKVIEQVQTGLDEALADRACLKITSDKQSYLDLQFHKCRYKGVYVHGRLRIELDTETGDCAGEPCVLATRYTTTITDLAIGKSQVRSATSVLRVPELKSEARSYTAEVELTDPADRELYLRQELTWRRQLGCVTAELGAEFMVDGREISVGARAVEVCGDECPRAGRVQVAWDDGKVLAWEYDGEAQLVVRGPRGREFVVEQACGDEQP